MSERTLKQLVGALAVAVALWLIVSLFAGGGGSIGASGDIADFFDGVDESSIEVVRLSGTDQPVELRREGSTWTVNGFAADSATVARFLTVLANGSVGDLAAANPANHERMGISEGEAETLEIEIDGATRTMLIGSQGPRYATVYGRLPGEDEVYLVEGDLRFHLIRLVDDWRDKRIVAIDADAVHRLEVARDGDTYTLVRADSVWTFEGGAAADPAAARNILMELSGLVAGGFAAEGDSLAGLPEGGRTVAYSESGEVLADITIGSGEAERWARAAGNDVLYRIPAFRVDRVAPTRESAEPTG